MSHSACELREVVGGIPLDNRDQLMDYLRSHLIGKDFPFQWSQPTIIAKFPSHDKRTPERLCQISFLPLDNSKNSNRNTDILLQIRIFWGWQKSYKRTSVWMRDIIT
jgi:hypothetical protein